MKLPTREMGEVTLLAISEHNGVWEAEWDVLRGTPVGDQFSVISQETLNHALWGWSWPLAQSLGPCPEGALRKIPKTARECVKRGSCPLFNVKQCHPLAKPNQMPWCFEPEGFSENVGKVATQAIEEWRAGVYLVVVKP